MVIYQNGKIYKIEDLAGEMCYIGSTTKDYLSKRMVEHRSHYKQWKNGTAGNVSVFTLFEKYGIDRCKIVLVELYPCDTRDELLKREAYHIKNMDCINKYIPIRTKEEQIEYKKQYYQDNRDDQISYTRQYYQDHKAKTKTTEL